MKWLALAIACALCSCGTTRYGSPWGKRATLAPSGERLWSAARNAALDPFVWQPLAAAAVLQIDDWDGDVSDWARRETPVFGSTNRAENASDDFRGASQHAWLLSALLVPSDDELQPWARDKFQGYVVQWSATYVASELTSLGKSGFGRQRPDNSDDRSLPSGHASAAFAYTTLARRNVDAMNVPEAARVGLDIGLVGLSAGSAWARVEAGKHYPSDVLVGAALGAFVARFVDDAFLDVQGGARLTAFVDPVESAWAVGVSWSF